MGTDAAQRYVIDHLQQRGAVLFTPVTGANDVHLAARGVDDQYVEILITTTTQGAPAVFHMGRFRPRQHLFVVGVVLEDGDPSEAWVLPSGGFARFADAGNLDLDGRDGEPLRQRLAIYRNRWKLITSYAKFRSTLTDPVALQLQLALDAT